ncbi:MAG: hypothetical protein AABX65_02805 [Nanoarchaeota archaeon]
MSILSLISAVFLQSRGIYSFQDLLNQPLFVETLSFLIIFGIVFAVLLNIKTFEDKKGIVAIIALAVGLLALQFGSVVNFFLIIFPKMGIGLAVLLVLMILAASFLNEGPANAGIYKWILFGVGAIIFLITVYTSFSDYSFFGSSWWNQYWNTIISAIIIIVAIVAVIATSSKSTSG